ncbi:hypothetical protein CsSME_00038846 [Camellia sinensis var. sinensis]
MRVAKEPFGGWASYTTGYPTISFIGDGITENCNKSDWDFKWSFCYSNIYACQFVFFSTFKLFF